MEFKSLNNIESSFRQIRLFGIVFVCMCCAVMCYSVWKAYSFAELQREKIYVLDQGKSLMLALSQDLSQNRPVEAPAVSMNFSSRSRRTKVPSRTISKEHCFSRTVPPIPITGIWRSRGTITVSSLVTSTNVWRLTAWRATSMCIPMRS